MKHVKNHIKKISISMMALALLPWNVAMAAPTVLVDPYENIPKVGTSSLNIFGGGLEPAATIDVVQQSIAPNPADGSEGQSTGVKVEERLVSTLTVDSNGDVAGAVPVSYDVAAGGSMDYCDNIAEAQRSCVLSLVYTSGSFVGLSLYVQNLYFGVDGPATPPPSVTVPLSKDDCKEDKWSDFVSLGFKNQGDCVSYVAAKN